MRFVYPGPGGEGEKDDDAAALTDFSLRVEPGETLGIVGASSSGKSTLMGLLLGFHRPVDGRILLDGEDMNRIDLRSYRRRLAVVSQETILYEGMVRENILYGIHRVNEARLRAALADANAAEFRRPTSWWKSARRRNCCAARTGRSRGCTRSSRCAWRDKNSVILSTASRRA